MKFYMFVLSDGRYIKENKQSKERFHQLLATKRKEEAMMLSEKEKNMFYHDFLESGNESPYILEDELSDSGKKIKIQKVIEHQLVEYREHDLENSRENRMRKFINFLGIEKIEMENEGEVLGEYLIYIDFKKKGIVMHDSAAIWFNKKDGKPTDFQMSPLPHKELDWNKLDKEMEQALEEFLQLRSAPQYAIYLLSAVQTMPDIRLKLLMEFGRITCM